MQQNKIIGGIVIKKALLTVICFIMLLFTVGCDVDNIVDDIDDDNNNTNNNTVDTALRDLTSTELAYFNSNDFMDLSYDKDSDDFFKAHFITSLYNSPEEINLYSLFYDGSSDFEYDDLNTKEKNAIMVAYDANSEVKDIKRATTEEINEDLQEYMGIRLSDTNKVGLDEFKYIAAYDAYYNVPSDTQVFEPIFTSGTKEGTTIKLYYTNHNVPNDVTILELKQVDDDDYYFISNTVKEQ